MKMHVGKNVKKKKKTDYEITLIKDRAPVRWSQTRKRIRLNRAAAQLECCSFLLHTVSKKRTLNQMLSTVKYPVKTVMMLSSVDYRFAHSSLRNIAN